MAAGTILTALSNIPWRQVIDNAPRVAAGATKLWNSVTRKDSHHTSDSPASPDSGAALSEVELLKKRLRAMDERVLGLQDQMDASVELIKALADQNAQLVQRVALNSDRLFRLALATAIGAVALLGIIAHLLLRP